jgi:outer membrane protein
MTYFLLRRVLLLAPFVVALLSSLLFIANAHADESADSETPAASNASGFGLGVAVGNRERPYKGLGSDIRVLPVISYENSWVRLQGLGAAFKLIDTGNVSFGLKVDYSLKGYTSSDAPILAGMEDRKGGLWIGPNARWRTEYVTLSGEVSTDLSGHSKGTQVKFSLDKTFRVGGFGIVPRVSALWLDRKYVNYYYGVEPNEATSDRPAYEGTSTVNVEVGLRTGYMLAPNQSVFLDVSTTRLGSGIRDSPLVDKSTQSGVRLGYIYRF